MTEVDDRRRRLLDLILGAGVGFGANYLYSLGSTRILRNKVFEAERRLLEEEAMIGRLRNQLDEASTGRRDYESLLKGKIAFGGGTNLKVLKNAKGEAVTMREVFSFDPFHVACHVEDNPEAFILPTQSLGQLNVEAHRFYMVMESNSVSSVTYGKDAAGKDEVTLRGAIDCATAAGTSSVSIGSRNAFEPAQFEAKAVDGGGGGGAAGDSFAIKVFFSRATAPIQFSVFGSEATFTGKMVEGEVTITEIGKLLHG